jgi:hypothetical protein
VWRLAELQSLTFVQRRFRRRYGHHPSTWKRILFFDNKLKITGVLLRVKSLGKTHTSEEYASHIKESFQRSPPKSTSAARLQLKI